MRGLGFKLWRLSETTTENESLSSLGVLAMSQEAGLCTLDVMNEPPIISDQEALRPVLDKLRAAQRVALDTEFVPEYTYYPHLCLIQVATEDVLAAIDTLALDDLSEFWQAIVRDDCEIVLHAGKEELLFCLRKTGRLPGAVFDVQLAAGFVGLGYPLSYSKLVRRVVGAEPVSGETRTDWRRRPLSRRQIEYALDDVRHLLAVRDYLDKNLQRLGRREWFDQESATNLERLRRADHAERWRRVSGVGALSGRQLAVLREIWNWRERRARTIDKPVKWVIRDDLMIELAKRQPTTIEEMKQTRGMGSVANARWAGEIIGAITAGKAAPFPESTGRSWRREDAEEAMVHKLVSAAMVHLATENQIAPALLGANEDLRQFVDWHASNYSTDPPLLAQGWRALVCGNNLKNLLDGNVAIRLQRTPDGPRILFEPFDAQAPQGE